MGCFLEVASAAINKIPEYPVGILIYPNKTDVALDALTATAINAAIAAGTVKGYLQEWSGIAGANIAEVNNAQPGTGKVNVTQHEIPADVYTFRDEMYLHQILKNKVTGYTFECLIIGDLGGVFGEKSLKEATISTMTINFSSNTSNGGFYDRANEKTNAITARYLHRELGYLDAAIEYEDIAPKIPLDFSVRGVTTQTATSIVLVMNLINAKTKAILTEFDADPITINAIVNGTVVSAAAAFANNQLTVTLTGTGFSTTANVINLSVSTATHYIDETKFNTSIFAQ